MLRVSPVGFSVADLRRRGRPGIRVVAFAIALVSLAADHLTKVFAVNHWVEPVHLIGPVTLATTSNGGAAFSIFQGRSVLLAVLGGVLAANLVVVLWRTRKWGIGLPIGLLLGGALGNGLERAFSSNHKVTDFIATGFWPVFNVADACITVACIWLGISLAFRARSDDGV